MLGKRIVGPRDVVLGWDPAVDEDKSDLTAYQEALFDFASGHIKIKPGSKPTVWRLGPLTEAQKRYAKGLKEQSTEWSDYVFRCGIHAITGYLISDDATGEREVTQPDRKDRPGMGEMASIEWLHGSGVALQDVEHVAMIAWIISEARPPLSKLSGQVAGL